MSRRVKVSYKGVFNRRYDIAAGCDTDKEIIVVAVLNAITGDVEVREFRQDHVDLVRCIEWFGERKPEIIIIESTSTYHQLYYDGLLAAGQNIHVINPMVVKSLLRVEGKSDKGDAITLARLAASFDLHTSNVADSMQREMRLMFRTYDRLKVSRLQIINGILAYLSQHGCTLFQHVGIDSTAALKMMDAIVLGLPPEQIVLQYPRSVKRSSLVSTIPPEMPMYFRYWLAQQVTLLREFNSRITETSKEILSMADKFCLQDQIHLMCTVPLLNPFLSLRIIAEMGHNFPKRYHSAAAFAKAIGVVPSNEVSGGKLLKRKGTHGNAGAKLALLQVAKAWSLHPDVTKSPNLVRWFVGYRKRANFMKATSALARRSVEHLYHVCRTGIPYDDSQNTRLTGVCEIVNPVEGASKKTPA